MIASLSWVDLAMLGMMLVSLLVGLWRGFVFEVLALAGWVVGFFVAQWYAAGLAPLLPVGEPGSPLRLGVAFALVFLGAAIAWGLMAKVVRMLVRATPLSVPDRLLGAGFGILRGGVLILVLATIVSYTPAAQSTQWKESNCALWSGEALRALRPVLPAEIVNWLPALGR